MLLKSKLVKAGPFCNRKFGKLCEQRTLHTVKYQFQMPIEEHVSGKNIFGLLLLAKAGKEKKSLPTWHCPFEPPANQHSQFGPSGLDWLYWLAVGLKEQCRK